VMMSKTHIVVMKVWANFNDAGMTLWQAQQQHLRHPDKVYCRCSLVILESVGRQIILVLHAGSIESGDFACTEALPLIDFDHGFFLPDSRRAFKFLINVRVLRHPVCTHNPVYMQSWLSASHSLQDDSHIGLKVLLAASLDHSLLL
jgi:hypothetical protein